MSAGTGPAVVVLMALGTRIEVRCEDPRTADRVRSAFADCVEAPGGGPDRPVDACVRSVGHGPSTVTASRAGTPLFEQEARTRADALGLVHAAVNAAAVQASPHLLAHAAVVGRDDRALVLPAASGTGKSTLAVALLQRGWTYLSDEAVCLPWAGGLACVPYPRPAALSPWSVQALGLAGRGLDAGTERLVRAGDAGSRAEQAPVRVAAVVILERSDRPDGASDPVVREVSRADVLSGLLARSFNHFRDPAAALDRFADLAEGCRVARLQVGPPARTAAAVEDWWAGG